jgi:hypothetical protein
MSAATKATHTPGPWSRNIRAGGKYPTVFAGRNQHVAQVSQQADPAETEANIDLIAAAPDLLAALRDLLALNPHAIGADKARAAIAKATGETP